MSIADKSAWSYFLCDCCKHCNVQVGCLLGKDVHGWKVARNDQQPLDVCENYEPKEVKREWTGSTQSN